MAIGVGVSYVAVVYVVVYVKKIPLRSGFVFAITIRVACEYIVEAVNMFLSQEDRAFHQSIREGVSVA